MRKVVDKKVYDTDKAEMVAECDNGLSWRDFRHVYEGLYRTAKGQYFLHAHGGPLSKYSECIGNNVHGVETLLLITAEEAFKWLGEHNKLEAIEKYFSEMIQEG